MKNFINLVVKETAQKIFYGFGFGLGMNIAFQVSKDKKEAFKKKD